MHMGLNAAERAILEAIIAEALVEGVRCNIHIPVTVMASRLAAAWRSGERDRQRLNSAAMSAEIIPLLAYRQYSSASAQRLESIYWARVPRALAYPRLLGAGDMSKRATEVMIVDSTGEWGIGLRNQLINHRVTACVLATRESAIAFARNRHVLAALVRKDEATNIWSSA
jgi:hypothetical protein